MTNPFKSIHSYKKSLSLSWVQFFFWMLLVAGMSAFGIYIFVSIIRDLIIGVSNVPSINITNIALAIAAFFLTNWLIIFYLGIIVMLYVLKASQVAWLSLVLSGLIASADGIFNFLSKADSRFLLVIMGMAVLYLLVKAAASEALQEHHENNS